MHINASYREEGNKGYYFLYFTPDDIQLVDEILDFIADSKIIDLSIDKAIKLPCWVERRTKALKKFKNQAIFIEIEYQLTDSLNDISNRQDTVMVDRKAIKKHIETVIAMFESNK